MFLGRLADITSRLLVTLISRILMMYQRITP